ncbi:MAG: hypothetical protein AAGA53_04095 [Pseudomonadota bacterium]
MANADTLNQCVKHPGLIKIVQLEATEKGHDSPKFRIKRAEDGQSLVYWHFGGRTGSFYAATFRTDGCAILTTSGTVRMFTFPKTAFNTGVFFELDVLETSP